MSQPLTQGLILRIGCPAWARSACTQSMNPLACSSVRWWPVPVRTAIAEEEEEVFFLFSFRSVCCPS